jgi:hypothetical protein
MFCRLKTLNRRVLADASNWVPEQLYPWPTTTKILSNPRAQP